MGIGAGSGMKRAIFLDRDGVINRNIWNPATQAYESPLAPEQFELLPNVISALQILRDREYLLFLVSNQPNYAKGKASMHTLNAIHDRLEKSLKEADISFAAYYYCFHHPVYTGWCICRKPSPYFLFKARNSFGIDLNHSWMIGDRETDIGCGSAAGTLTLKISTIHETKTSADYVVADLWSAVKFMSNHSDR
jgi:D-glycero-D-manno-heptose 1,7-bisphosphate phosphatase